MEMRIGVIDVGSNTTRLLVASAGPKGVHALEKQKVRLSLGEEIERFGAVSAVHCAAAVKAVREMASTARRSQVDSLDVFLTAPGRQATNADELVSALSRAAGVQARVLTKDEEGTLAYRGAVLTAETDLPSRVAVCDIGGASTEIAIGSSAHEPDWIESVDLGSVRLTTRAGDMHEEAEAQFAHLAPPSVEAALAVGGSARAARRLVGAELGEEELAEALRIVETDLAARGRPALRRRPGARRHPPGRGDPARGGAAEARSSAPRLRRRHPRGSRTRLARRARRLGRGDLAHDRAALENDGRALLQASRDERVDDVAMRAGHDTVLAQQLCGGRAHSLAEAIVMLERQAERRGERLDRLDAASVGARDDAANPERSQQLDELRCLVPTAKVERAKPVVAAPVALVAGRSVPDEHARHRPSSSGRSRDQVSRSAASSGASQRISSTSAWGSNSPASGRMRQ